MKIFVDLLLINLSAIFAFIFRGYFGDVAKQPPLVFWGKYVLALFSFNLVYFTVAWLVSLYDKRIKRALLEDLALILGVVLIAISFLIVFLFLGRLWWLSRTVLYLFLGLMFLTLCFSHTLLKSKPSTEKVKVKIEEIKKYLAMKTRPTSWAFLKPFSIVIVTFNSKDKLSQCLNSIKEARISIPYEIVVVDNNSSDGTAEFVKTQNLLIKLIENSANLGFSKAVNLGIQNAQHPSILILNPDIIVLPGTIECMLAFLDENPMVGLVGCKLLNEDGSLQDSVRRFLDLRTYLYRFTPLRGLLAGSAIEKYYLMQEWDHNNNRIVDWVLGGCMLVKKEAIQSVGMMDEKIFMYFDDVDWCYRMWEKGWQVAYVAEAVMIHKHMRTSANKIINRATIEHLKSLLYFLKKHGVRLPSGCPSTQE